MAAQDWPIFQKGVLAHEGSKYTDGVHPYDPGGPTRWGITLTDYRLHFNKNGTAEDVRNMPVTVAIGIYKSKYWDKVRGDDLPAGLDYSTADYGVNSGVGRAGKVLRRLLSLPDHTSVIDAIVLAAIAKRDVKALIAAMNDERLRFLQQLAIWPTYKNGWTTRVREVKALSLQLAATAAGAPPTPIAVTPTVDTTTIAKGMVPEPKGLKNTIKTGAPTVGGGVGYSWWDWIGAHPVQASAIAISAVLLVVTVLKLINEHHRAKQEAPTPGLVPVPELPRAAVAA